MKIIKRSFIYYLEQLLKVVSFTNFQLDEELIMINKRYFSEYIQKEWKKKGIFSNILYPISLIIIFFNIIKKKLYEFKILKKYKFNIPVVIVGNIYIGGTGKTPVVIALVNKLKKLGWRPGVISRGYGVKISKYADTYIRNLDPEKTGDEPALINKETKVPISVHPNRIKAVKSLLNYDKKINIVICDDGLQYTSLERDFEIIVQDERKYGNRRIIPSGPLRESIKRINKVDMVINNISNNYNKEKYLHINSTEIREIDMFLEPYNIRNILNPKIILSFNKFTSRDFFKKIVALAGIGNHDRFINTLNLCGIYPDTYIRLEDHYKFKKFDLSKITADAILMTSKDAIKCSKFKDKRLWEVRTKTKFSDNLFVNKLSDKLANDYYNNKI